MKNTISIIVPVYNQEKYLSKCIETIISQTFTNLEIILVNDGSTDNSARICDEYKKIDTRIKVIHKENGGLSDSRNRGLDIATGDFIGFVDSDDFIEINMYETLYKLIEKYNTDISIVSYNNIKNHNKIPKDDSNELHIYNQEEALINIIIDKKIQSYVWNKLFKAELFKDIRFPVGVILEDVYTMYNIFKKIENVVYLEVPLYNYVYRADSLLHKFQEKKLESFFNVIIYRFNQVKYEYPHLDKYNSLSLIIWVTRIYCIMVEENDTDDIFLKNQFSTIKNTFERQKKYILDNLDPFMCIVLYLMLWDLKKGRKVIELLLSLE